MTDEKFCFISDVREKKWTATGAYHKRTHCGKGGAVKFPSDYMTAKERKAMNGEVKSYKLNDPMTWEEFKAMPEDVQVCYVKALREKFGASDSKIAAMLGVKQPNFSVHSRILGIGLGRNCNPKMKDKDAWFAWCNGVKAKTVAEENDTAEYRGEEFAPAHENRFSLEKVERADAVKIAPSEAIMKFEGDASAALDVVKQILGNRVVKLAVQWEVVDGD